jgi:hypothetical protein
MAKEESRGEISYGLEIEFDGEIHEEEVESDTEVLAGDQWGPSKVERGRIRWLAWKATADERLRLWWHRTRKQLTWRIAAWAAAAALLGFGIGVVAEPSAKHTAQLYLSTDFNLHFDNQAITAPGQAQMMALTGAAWSVTPATTLILHVVNDGSMTLQLHNGTLSGTRLSNGTLTPDGSGVLAPGQHGTLTAHVTVSCVNAPSDLAENTPTRPLTANIPVSTQHGPTSIVQLVSGSTQDDLYIASQLCTDLPVPLTISFLEIPGITGSGITVPGITGLGITPLTGSAIQITVHNITAQPILFAPELSFQPVNTAKMQKIAGRATIVLDIPLSQICPTPSLAYVSPSAGLYMSTVNGSYQTSHQVAINTDPQLSAACYG